MSSLHARGLLRAGLSATAATDLLWTLNHPDVCQLLVRERKWSPQAWERWLADASRRELLGEAPEP